MKVLILAICFTLSPIYSSCHHFTPVYFSPGVPYTPVLPHMVRTRNGKLITQTGNLVTTKTPLKEKVTDLAKDYVANNVADRSTSENTTVQKKIQGNEEAKQSATTITTNGKDTFINNNYIKQNPENIIKKNAEETVMNEDNILTNEDGMNPIIETNIIQNENVHDKLQNLDLNEAKDKAQKYFQNFKSDIRDAESNRLLGEKMIKELKSGFSQANGRDNSITKTVLIKNKIPLNTKLYKTVIKKKEKLNTNDTKGKTSDHMKKQKNNIRLVNILIRRHIIRRKIIKIIKVTKTKRIIKKAINSKNLPVIKNKVIIEETIKRKFPVLKSNFKDLTTNKLNNEIIKNKLGQVKNSKYAELYGIKMNSLSGDIYNKIKNINVSPAINKQIPSIKNKVTEYTAELKSFSTSNNKKAELLKKIEDLKNYEKAKIKLENKKLLAEEILSNYNKPVREKVVQVNTYLRREFPTTKNTILKDLKPIHNHIAAKSSTAKMYASRLKSFSTSNNKKAELLKKIEDLKNYEKAKIKLEDKKLLVKKMLSEYNKRSVRKKVVQINMFVRRKFPTTENTILKGLKQFHNYIPEDKKTELHKLVSQINYENIKEKIPAVKSGSRKYVSSLKPFTMSKVDKFRLNTKVQIKKIKRPHIHFNKDGLINKIVANKKISEYYAPLSEQGYKFTRKKIEFNEKIRNKFHDMNSLKPVKIFERDEMKILNGKLHDLKNIKKTTFYFNKDNFMNKIHSNKIANKYDKHIIDDYNKFFCNIPQNFKPVIKRPKLEFQLSGFIDNPFPGIKEFPFENRETLAVALLQNKPKIKNISNYRPSFLKPYLSGVKNYMESKYIQSEKLLNEIQEAEDAALNNLKASNENQINKSLQELNKEGISEKEFQNDFELGKQTSDSEQPGDNSIGLMNRLKIKGKQALLQSATKKIHQENSEKLKKDISNEYNSLKENVIKFKDAYENSSLTPQAEENELNHGSQFEQQIVKNGEIDKQSSESTNGMNAKENEEKVDGVKKYKQYVIKTTRRRKKKGSKKETEKIPTNLQNVNEEGMSSKPEE